MTRRYAVYAVPGLAGEPSGVAVKEAVEAWLALPANAGITRDARRYGYHATLKAPFRLTAGPVEDDLVAAVASFAAAVEPVVLPRLQLARLGGFFALVPGEGSERLSRIADAVVAVFDGFRAAPTPEETARRRPSTLTGRQRELLAQWGYPYVFDEFRFHITLTDSIPASEAERDGVEPALRAALAEVLDRDAVLDAVAVFVEPAPGAPFEIHSVHPLGARSSS